MVLKMRVGIVGGTLLAAAGLILWSGSSRAGEDDAKIAAAIVGVKKVAAAIKSGDMDAAAKEAAALAKKLDTSDRDNLGYAMNLLKTRKKGGLGVGPKAGAASVDGIELMLQNIGRDVPTANQMKKEGEWIEEMAYQIAAIAEIAKSFPPKMGKGQASKKNWDTWSNDMSEHSIALAKAAAKKGGAEVKTIASKLNNSCNLCHPPFRGKSIK